MPRSKPKLTVIMYSPENESPGFLGVSYSFYHTDEAADRFIYAMKVLGWSLMVRRPFHDGHDIPRMHILDQKEFQPC